MRSRSERFARWCLRRLAPDLADELAEVDEEEARAREILAVVTTERDAIRNTMRDLEAVLVKPAAPVSSAQLHGGPCDGRPIAQPIDPRIERIVVPRKDGCHVYLQRRPAGCPDRFVYDHTTTRLGDAVHQPSTVLHHEPRKRWWVRAVCWWRGHRDVVRTLGRVCTRCGREA